MTTKSTEEAMAVLKAARAEMIEIGREIAVELCHKNGMTHTRDVYREMGRRGLLDERISGQFWLGAVFNRCPLFKKAGIIHKHSDRSLTNERGTHLGKVNYWKLR